MKKLSILIILFLIAQISNAQNFYPIFPGEDCQSLRGSFLKLGNWGGSEFSHSFYTDSINALKDTSDEGILYPSEKDKTITKRTSLENKTFRVDRVIENEKLGIYAIFILRDTSTKQLIYFKFDKQYGSMPFNTTNITEYQKMVCSELSREVDDMTGKISISSPILQNAVIYKDISKKSTVYYLSLKTTGSTCVVYEKGVTVLFTDGTKWIKPNEKIDVDADNGFNYSAFITLSKQDLLLFSTKKIKKFRLYIFDDEPLDADKFAIYAKCIQKAK